MPAGQHQATIPEATLVLTALPDFAVMSVFLHLSQNLTATVSLAQTCRAFASEFALHRSSILMQRCSEVQPTYTLTGEPHWLP